MRAHEQLPVSLHTRKGGLASPDGVTVHQVVGVAQDLVLCLECRQLSAVSFLYGILRRARRRSLLFGPRQEARRHVRW
jgi:hypothetical protein